MISSRYHGSIRLHFLLKLLGGLFMYWGIVWGLHALFYGDLLVPRDYLWLWLFIPTAAVIELVAREKKLRSLSGLPRERIASVTQREILFVLAAIFGVVVMSKDDRFSRAFLALFAFSYSLWIAWMNQVGYRQIQRHLFRRTPGRSADTLVLAPPREIERDSAWRMQAVLPGSELLGYVSYGQTAALALPDRPILGEFENLKEICRHCRARILLAMGLEDEAHLIAPLQRLCDSFGMRLIWVDDKRRDFAGNLDTHQTGSHVLVTNWREPLEDPLNRVAKRALDITIATAVSLTVLPVTAVIVWTMHRLFSPGPLFYRQPRTGRDQQVFGILKFRTMHLNNTPAAQATVGDPRIFRGGRWLRKCSIDEFPQFLNVLRGEMSLVGPRPHFVEHDEQFAEIVEDYRIRQFAKPGVTGLAQVRGQRGETDTPRKVRNRVKLDQFYLRHWTLWLDLYIVLCTAVQVLFPPRNAR